MNRLHDQLEGPPSAEDQRSERRWTWVSLGTLVLICGVVGGSLWLVSQRSAILPQGVADHGPLPPQIKEEVLSLLAPHLDQVVFFEFPEKGRREFHIKGRARPLLSKDFYQGFRPLVAERLRPLLAPYGEVLSFDIASLDLPPVRLRAFAAPQGTH